MKSLRDEVAEVLHDFREGLLGSADEGVDAILALPRIAEALRLADGIKPWMQRSILESSPAPESNSEGA